jgi:hypothetical protein
MRQPQNLNTAFSTRDHARTSYIRATDILQPEMQGSRHAETSSLKNVNVGESSPVAVKTCQNGFARFARFARCANPYCIGSKTCTRGQGARRFVDSESMQDAVQHALEDCNAKGAGGNVYAERQHVLNSAVA